MGNLCSVSESLEIGLGLIGITVNVAVLNGVLSCRLQLSMQNVGGKEFEQNESTMLVYVR